MFEGLNFENETPAVLIENLSRAIEPNPEQKKALEQIWLEEITTGIKEGRFKSVGEKINEHKIPQEIIDQAVSDGLKYRFSLKQYGGMNLIRQDFGISEEVIRRTEEEYIASQISNSSFYKEALQELVDNLNISDDQLKNIGRKMLWQAAKGEYGNSYLLHSAVNKLSIPEAELRSVGKEVMIEKLQQGEADWVKSLIDLYKLQPEDLSDPKIEQAYIKFIVDSLGSDAKFAEAVPVFEAMPISEAIRTRPEVIMAVNGLGDDERNYIQPYVLFHLNKNFKLSPEQLDQRLSRILFKELVYLNDYNVQRINEIKQQFGISDEKFSGIVASFVLPYLRERKLSGVKKAIETYPILDRDLADTDFHSAVLEMVDSCMNQRDMDSLALFEKNCGVSSLEIREKGKKIFLSYIAIGSFETAAYYLSKLPGLREDISIADIKDQMWAGINEKIERKQPAHWGNDLKSLHDTFSFTVPECQSAAKRAVVSFVQGRSPSAASAEVALASINDQFPESLPIGQQEKTPADQAVYSSLREAYSHTYKNLEAFILGNYDIEENADRNAGRAALSDLIRSSHFDLVRTMMERFKFSRQELVEAAADSFGQRMELLVKESYDKFTAEFSPSTDEHVKIVTKLIDKKGPEQLLGHTEAFPDSAISSLENRYHFLAYRRDLMDLPVKSIYLQYLDLKEKKDELQLAGFIEKVRNQVDSLISSGQQESSIVSTESYKELIEAVFQNNSNSWASYDSNERCLDRSDDLKDLTIKNVYEIDLQDGVEMVLRPGKDKDVAGLNRVEENIRRAQEMGSAVGFNREKMFDEFDKKLADALENNEKAKEFISREEKIFFLLLESLVGRMDVPTLRDIVMSYEFAEFEDVKAYLEGTRMKAEQSKNVDYAYLLQLREFFADHLKDVQRKVSDTALQNESVKSLLPIYYKEKHEQDQGPQRQAALNKLQVEKIGLTDTLMTRIINELKKSTNKKGETLELVEEGEDGEITLGKKGQALAQMILSEQRKASQAIEVINGEKVAPESINLGDLNLKELLDEEQQIKEGVFNEDLFSRYLVCAFQSVFEKELSFIDTELAKYQPKDEELKGKQMRQVECFITKNHTSAHARQVGGVCVSGDNPRPYTVEANMWEMPNFMQMVLRDKQTKVCQGVVLLHHYEDNGKKILTASFNPSSTYLYKVDERQMFNKLLEQLETFAVENDFDMITMSQHKNIRTNRTGGEFERQMDDTVKKVGKTYKFAEPQTFSYKPNYYQQDLDIIWEKTA